MLSGLSVLLRTLSGIDKEEESISRLGLGTHLVKEKMSKTGHQQHQEV